jgi:hypothetical protein
MVIKVEFRPLSWTEGCVRTSWYKAFVLRYNQASRIHKVLYGLCAQPGLSPFQPYENGYFHIRKYADAKLGKFYDEIWRSGKLRPQTVEHPCRSAYSGRNPAYFGALIMCHLHFRNDASTRYEQCIQQRNPHEVKRSGVKVKGGVCGVRD